MDDDTYQITVKGKDKGVNENRLEIDVNSDSPGAKIHKLIESAFGKPAGRVTKHYHVYWPNKSPYLTISCYQVQEDDRVFVEVESTSASSLDEWEGYVSNGFEKHNMIMERAPGSLYEMFIVGNYRRIS